MQTSGNRQAMTDYYEMLARLQELLQPRTYVEIGFRQGLSFALAKNAAHSVAIDPAPDVQIALPAGARLFKLTSDEFFASITCGLNWETTWWIWLLLTECIFLNSRCAISSTWKNTAARLPP